MRYSEEIVSAGGLAAFVEAAVGRRLALVQAAIWAFSYFLYLPYTVTDIVYEMLADIFPGIEPWRWLIELLLPLAIVGLVLLGTKPVLRLLARLGGAPARVDARARLRRCSRSPGRPLTRSHTRRGRTGSCRGGANIALLFLCGSLPIFLGAEVIGGSRTVRRTLVGAGTIVAAYLIFAMFPLAAVDPALTQADLPGYAIASAYSSRWFAVTIGVGAAASVAGLIVAEYLALSRLLFSVTGIHMRKLLAWIAVPFVAVDALSIADPESFDENVLRPSLIALFLSQLIVFAVFPIYRRRRGRLTPVDVLLAAGAFALMAWGLYRAISRARQHVEAALRLAHEPLACSAHERHRLGEQHAHRIAHRDRLLFGAARHLNLGERSRGQLDGGVESQRRELLALSLLHRLRLLLCELTQSAQEILRVAAERESESTFRHATKLAQLDQVAALDVLHELLHGAGRRPDRRRERGRQLAERLLECSGRDTYLVEVGRRGDPRRRADRPLERERSLLRLLDARGLFDHPHLGQL